jgi:hypothetical protein
MSVLLLVGCRYAEIKKNWPDINHIAPGEKFRINLPEDHSKGEIWQLKEGYSRGLVESLNAAWHGNKKGVDFNFRALAAGQTTISFQKRLYADTVENRRFVVRIANN